MQQQKNKERELGVLLGILRHITDYVYISRPQWEKCGQYIEGGTERWNEVSQNRTSDELVDVLLAEMTGQDIALIQSGVSTAAEYFEGQVSD
jgi:hypothetical protein